MFKGTYSNNIITDEVEFSYKFDIDIENKIIKNITAGTKVSDILKEIKNTTSSNIKLLNSDGTEKTNNDIIKTGDLLQIYIDDNKKNEYIFSVIGDCSGDGLVNSLDLVQLRKHIVEYKNSETGEIEVKTGVYKESIDINGDQDITSLDLVMLRKIIVELIEPISIKLNFNDLTLEEGDTYNLEYYITPSNVNNNKVIWTSSEPSVATIDQNGKITAVANGITTITVTTENGEKKATCNVTVGEISLNISKTSVTIIDENKTTLKANLSSDLISDQTVTWTSSDTSIATVSEDGIVTAKKTGSATITATSNYDKSLTAKCTVKVRAAKYLFVGNSKTYYPERPEDNQGIPKRFKSIAKNAGYEIEYVSAVVGGKTLNEIITDYPEQVEKIKSKYDYVVLQEGTASKDLTTYHDSVEQIKEWVEQENNIVNVYLRKTWIKIKKDEDGKPSGGWTAEKIQERFDNTDYIVEKLGIGVINDGPLFYDVIDNSNIEIMIYQSEDSTDLVHQNENGAYLAALCIFSEIYGKDPTEITYNASIKESTVNTLKTYAKKHCYN